MDTAFWRGLELTKATILRLNIPGVDLNDWLLPTPIIKPEDYLGALVDGAWAMAYHRYCEWHDEQRRLAYLPSDLSDLSDSPSDKSIA